MLFDAVLGYTHTHTPTHTCARTHAHYYFALHVGFRSGLVLMPLRDSSKNSSKNLVGVGWIRARVRGWGWLNLGALLKECAFVGGYSQSGGIPNLA